MGYYGWQRTPNTDPLLAGTMEPTWFDDNWQNLKDVSFQMMHCLRHKGCFRGDLGCDSGGWYLFEGIIAEVQKGQRGPHWAQNIGYIVGNMFPAF